MMNFKVQLLRYMSVFMAAGLLSSTLTAAEMSSSEFFSTYDYTSEFAAQKNRNKSRALERILPNLIKVHRYLLLQTADGDLLLQPRSTQVRTAIFQLEGAFRLYDRIYGSEFKNLKKLVKGYEDAIGHWDAWNEFIRYGQSLSADSEAIHILESHREKNAKELREEIHKNWLVQKNGKVPGIEQILSTFAASKAVKSDCQDATLLVEQIIKQTNDLIDTELDLNQLEEGLHELRRQIRWLAIYFSAIDGVVTIGEGIGASEDPFYNGLLELPIAESKYARLYPTGLEPYSIELSKPYFLGLTYFIGALGDLKDHGQDQEFLIHAYMEAGITSTFEETQHLIAELEGDSTQTVADVLEETKKLHRHLVDSKLLEKIAQELESNVDNICQ